MSSEASFRAAFPYQGSALALPVKDIEAATRWYSRCFGMTEVERRAHPTRVVMLERDGTRLGFAENGGDAAQEGAAILVTGIDALRRQLEAQGVSVGDWRIDERDGHRLKVFFVIAPDGLCYYFHEPLIEESSAPGRP